MSQSLALVLVHIIFSTKNRMPFLQSAEYVWDWSRWAYALSGRNRLLDGSRGWNPGL